MTLQEIRQRKAARTAEARAIVAKAEAEKRQLTAEESANFATIRADIESLEQAEQRQQFLDDAERRAAGVTVIAGNGADTIAAPAAPAARRRACSCRCPRWNVASTPPAVA